MVKSSRKMSKIESLPPHKDGQGYKKISASLKVSPNTVAKVIQRFSKKRTTMSCARQGRPAKMTARTVRQVQNLVLQDRRQSAAKIAEEISTASGQSVSAQTIRRTLHRIGLHGRRPRRKPLLKQSHKKARKQFAEAHQSKPLDYWQHVLWSDETKINLFGSDGVQRVWRRPGEQNQDKCVIPTVKLQTYILYITIIESLSPHRISYIYLSGFLVIPVFKISFF